MFTASKLALFLATPSNGLVIAGLLGTTLAVLVPSLSGIGLRVTLLTLLALVVLGLGPVAGWIISPLENRFARPEADGESVTGVVVLGGAVHPKTSFARGQLTVGDGGERVIAMADLARRHPGTRIDRTTIFPSSTPIATPMPTTESPGFSSGWSSPAASSAAASGFASARVSDRSRRSVRAASRSRRSSNSNLKFSRNGSSRRGDGSSASPFTPGVIAPRWAGTCVSASAARASSTARSNRPATASRRAAL